MGTCDKTHRVPLECGEAHLVPYKEGVMEIIWERGIAHDMGGSFHSVWQDLRLDIIKEEIMTDEYIEIQFVIIGTGQKFKTEVELIVALKAAGRV